MLERTALTLLLLVAGIAAYRLYVWIRLRGSRRNGLGLAGYHPGRPAILYFTAPGCGPCLAIQNPALEELTAQAGDRLQIIKVDALERPAVADAWGVLSVPTTFLIDSHGQPRGVNNGAVRAPQLREQLAAIGGFLGDASEDLGDVEPEMQAAQSARAKAKLYNQGVQPKVNL